MNTKQIRNVDISGIQHLPMIDFIGNDFAIFDDIRDIPFTPYPTRLNAACFAVCRKGWCKLNINLRDYEMREGMLCIILPEQIVQQGVTLYILCNPHNPVGRVYTEEELRRVGEICRRHHVFVIADEIHSDLIFPGHQHIVFASLGQDYAENCAVCHAPSKTFNLAGLSFSCIMIPNEERRKRFDQMFARYCRAHPNFFAPVAAKAAWDHGEAWLVSCLAYIQKNDQFVREFAEDTWNGDVKISPLEGTYLQWIDFRRLEPDAEKLRQKMLYQAHVAMDEGSMFGPEGNGFERLNLAAPRNLIEEIMDRIAAVLR